MAPIEPTTTQIETAKNNFNLLALELFGLSLSAGGHESGGVVLWGPKYEAAVLETLADCTDIMPPATCKMLGVDEGSTYADGISCVKERTKAKIPA